MAASAGGSPAATTNLTNQIARLALDLTDGSHITGIPRITSIPIQTAYAKMDIPLNVIRKIKVEAAHETVSLALSNGDKLDGTLLLKQFQLNTPFGEITVKLAHIAGIAVAQGGRGVLPAGLQNDLILHYSFDANDGEKVKDDSGKGNDGMVEGAAWAADGKQGGAYRFDGKAAGIVSKQNVGLSGSKPNTICAWFKTKNFTDHTCIWSLGAGYSNGQNLHGPCVMGNALKIHHGGIGDTLTTTLDPEKWNFVCLNYDGTAHTLYLNGAAARNENRPMQLGDGPLHVGRWQSGGQYHYFFDGFIDEVLIFNRALTAEEVKALYDAQN
jgi:hypothetical protein